MPVGYPRIPQQGLAEKGVYELNSLAPPIGLSGRTEEGLSHVVEEPPYGQLFRKAPPQGKKPVGDISAEQGDIQPVKGLPLSGGGLLCEGEGDLGSLSYLPRKVLRHGKKGADPPLPGLPFTDAVVYGVHLVDRHLGEEGVEG